MGWDYLKCNPSWLCSFTDQRFSFFAFNDQQLRGVKIDGEPWFVATDERDTQDAFGEDFEF